MIFINYDLCQSKKFNEVLEFNKFFYLESPDIHKLIRFAFFVYFPFSKTIMVLLYLEFPRIL